MLVLCNVFTSLIKKEEGIKMKNQKPLTGVGFVLFNHRGEIFTVKELKSKPEYSKEAGMISFPLETQEDFDNGDTDTVERLIEEEMDPRLRAHISCFVRDKNDFNLIPGRPDIITRYHFGFLTKKAPIDDIKIVEEDIKFHGWMNPTRLFLSDLIRVEVRPILKHLFENYHNRF
jgi:hypothetical protein